MTTGTRPATPKRSAEMDPMPMEARRLLEHNITWDMIQATQEDLITIIKNVTSFIPRTAAESPDQLEHALTNLG